MTREAFIEVLKEKGCSYEIEGNKIVVTGEWNIGFALPPLYSLPPDVVFKNGGDLYMKNLTSLSPGVEFKNGGDLHIKNLTSLPPDVVFKNGREVWLGSLTSLPPGVEFKNGEGVWLRDLIGGWFNEWKGNIEGIDSKRLLNAMISLGLFEKRR
jgi:hypothetical protein